MNVRRCLRVSLLVSLGMTPSLIWAQGPFARLTGFFGNSNPPYPQAMPVQQQQAPQITDQPRSSEIAVELAWLSDPATFPYPLTVRNAGNGLQVHGFVPSEAVRQRALYLAKRNTTMPVFDATKVHPGLNAPRPAAVPNLPQVATEAIRNAMPEQARNLRLNVGNNGAITVAGMVSSHEEKLVISQTLRQVAGCTSVVNTVQVNGAYGSNYGGYQDNPQYPTNSRNGAPTLTNSPLVRGTLNFFGFGPNPNPQQQQQQVTQHVTQYPNPNQYPPNMRNFDGPQGNMPPQNTMAATGNAPPANRPARNDDYTSPYHASAGTEQQPPDSTWRTSSATSPEISTTPASHTTQVIGASGNGPPVRTVRQPEPPLYSGDDGLPVIARSDQKRTPQPAPNVPQPYEPPLIDDVDSTPIEQEPITSQPIAPPMQKQATGPKLSTMQLKMRIEALCGGSVRNVAVEHGAGGKLSIKMQLVEGAREQQVIDRVIGMPELRPYQEQLQLNLELPAPQIPGQGEPQIINEPLRR